MSTTVVLKYGGHAMNIPQLREAFGHDLLELANSGTRFVIVHGGGPQIANMLDRLGIESAFINGLRVTDKPTLEVVEMVLCGQVNKEVARGLARFGINTVGISGEDGNTIIARQKDPELGHVGEIVKVNPKLVETLLDGGFMPVIAPVGLDEKGTPININADTAAGALAGALHAQYFVLISDIPGVMDPEGNVFPSLDASTISTLCASEVITGGMLPKVSACQQALNSGCAQTIILDGRQPGSLKRYLAGKEALGTSIKL